MRPKPPAALGAADESAATAVIEEASLDTTEKKRKRVDTYYDNVTPEAQEALSAKDDRTLMVRQLHPRAGEFDVFELFSKAGMVTDVRLIVNDRTGRCEGVGYVEMASAADVDKCLALNGTELCGSAILVQHSLAIKNRLSSQGASNNEVRAAGQMTALGMPGAAGFGSGLVPPPPPSGGGRAEDGLRVYVGGLDYSFTEAQIREIFISFGQLDKVDLQHDPLTGMSRGFAFCHFKDADAGRRCVEQMDGFQLAGRVIKVNVAGSKESSAAAAPPVLNPMAAAAAGFGGSLQLAGAWSTGAAAMGGGGMGGVGMGGGGIGGGGIGGGGTGGGMGASIGNDAISSMDGLDESVGKSGGGEKLGASQRASLLMKLAQNAGMEVPDETRKAAAQSYSYNQANDLSGDGSRCVVLKNMFDRLSEEATANPNFFSELSEDVRGECAKLGTVLFCQCDKWSNGFVYVKMLAANEAARLIEVMHGRFFAKNKILASHVPEDTIDKKFKLAKYVGRR